MKAKIKSINATLSQGDRNEDIETLTKLAREYDILRAQIKNAQEAQKNITEKIKDLLKLVGQKNDKGSFVVDSPEFIIENVAKKSIKFNVDKSEAFFKGRGIEDCIKYTPTVDEKAVDEALSRGDITPEDIEDIVDVKTSYAINIKKKAELGSVQAVKVAARVKKPVRGRS